MLMQADLAEYHTQKIMAALELSFYHKTQNTDSLKKALKFAMSSLECWRTLSERGSVYHYDLQFGVGGVGRSKHWKDRLPELEKDVAKLKSMLEEKEIGILADSIEINDFNCIESVNNFSSVESDVPEFWVAGKELEVNVKVGELNRLCCNMKLHYRHMNQLDGRFIVADMEKTDTGYQGKISGDYITYEWDLMVYFSGVDKNNNVMIYPGVYHPTLLAPYHIVKIIK